MLYEKVLKVVFFRRAVVRENLKPSTSGRFDA